MEIKLTSEEEIKDYIKYLDLKKELYFLDDNKRIYDIAILSHPKKEAIDAILNDFKVNSINKIIYIYHEDDAFIGVRKEREDLVIVTNMEYLSPRLLMRGLIIILSSIFDFCFNDDKLTISNFNVKVLTNTEDKKDYYKDEFLRVEYLEEERCFHYRQRFKSMIFTKFISKLLNLSFELALPVVLMGAEEENQELLSITSEEFDAKISREDDICQYLLKIAAIIKGSYFVPRVVGDKMAGKCASLYIPHLAMHGKSLRDENLEYERKERNVLESKEFKDYFDLIKSRNRQDDVKKSILKR